MMYFSEKAMDPFVYFHPGSFTKSEKGYYFISEEMSDTKYRGIKLKDQGEYDCVCLLIAIDEDGAEYVEREDVINDTIDPDDKREMFQDLFSYLHGEPFVSDVRFDESVAGLIMSLKVEPHYSYAEKDRLYCEFLSLFILEGRATTGYYEGNLMLTEVVLKNRFTGQVIKHFDDIMIADNFQVEDDFKQETMEALLESLSEADINQYFQSTKLF